MNDSELGLLGLLGELHSVSGYGLASVARARGMERWAGLSASSVYKGLRHLEAEKLVRATANRKKTGKGPVGQLFALSDAGGKVTRQAIVEALASAPEQSSRFRLSLAFVDLIDHKLAVHGLQERARQIRARLREVAVARARDEPAQATSGALLVFSYVCSSLEHEQAAIDKLIRLLKKRSAA